MKKRFLFAFRVSTNGEAVDITKNIVERGTTCWGVHTADSIGKESKHRMVSAVKKR